MLPLKWVWEKWIRECTPYGMKWERLKKQSKSLVGQKNNILKRKYLADFEQEEIQRNIVDIGHGEVGLESNEDEGCS